MAVWKPQVWAKSWWGKGDNVHLAREIADVIYGEDQERIMKKRAVTIFTPSSKAVL